MSRRIQAGDTLVEVLLAMTILATVVAGAFGLSSRASRIGISSQERSEVVRLLEQQAEMMRTVFADEAYAAVEASIDANESEQCLYFHEGSGSIRYSGVGDWETFCQGHEGTIYDIYLEQTAQATYRSSAVWQGIGGEGQQTSTLDYRLR